MQTVGVRNLQSGLVHAMRAAAVRHCPHSGKMALPVFQAAEQLRAPGQESRCTELTQPAAAAHILHISSTSTASSTSSTGCVALGPASKQPAPARALSGLACCCATGLCAAAAAMQTQAALEDKDGGGVLQLLACGTDTTAGNIIQQLVILCTNQNTLLLSKQRERFAEFHGIRHGLLSTGCAIRNTSDPGHAQAVTNNGCQQSGMQQPNPTQPNPTQP